MASRSITAKGKRRPNARQAALLKNLMKGMSLTNAARKAGYSQKRPGQSGYQALNQMAQSTPEVMERQGLTNEALIEKYLRPALEAQETKFFAFKGVVKDGLR
jgi:phage terminase small subunit